MSNLQISLIGTVVVVSIWIILMFLGMIFNWLVGDEEKRRLGFVLTSILFLTVGSFTMSYFLLYPFVTGDWAPFI